MAEPLAVRVRFAPSPTGSLHIGGVRTALFNWLFARRHGGAFVLRIEDTDLARSTRESEAGILNDFQWLGLDWNEGPDPSGGGPPVEGRRENRPAHKGDYGPYRQTDRREEYWRMVDELLEKGYVYPCFCLEEELEAKRQEALKRGETPRYDGTCFRRSQAELDRLGTRVDPAFRFHVPEERGTIVVRDQVRGDVEFDASAIGDFVIMKSPRERGVPTYNFACVVDDALMGITHVIRGDEHLVNTPRQLLLYEALGIDPPEFAHLPMILAPDHSKLSKRHGTTAVAEFREQGFLPQALLNYVALLGWSPPRELFNLEAPEGLGDLAREFSLDRVSKSPSIFDIEKLKWFNGQYLRRASPAGVVRHLLGIEASSRTSLDAIVAEEYRKSLAAEGWEPTDPVVLEHLVAGTLERPALLPEIRQEVAEFVGMPEPDQEATSLLAGPESAEVLAAFCESLDQRDLASTDGFKAAMKEVQVRTGRKGKDLYLPIRAAISGRLHGPELVHLVPVQAARFGREGIASRIRKILTKRRKGDGA